MAPYHFATVENRWAEVLHPLLPQSWYPQSQEAIINFYNGISGGRSMGWLEVIKSIPWDAWLGPLLGWTGFILLCYLVMICIINLLSKQPLYNERMNFPLLRVPLLMQEALDKNEFGRFTGCISGQAWAKILPFQPLEVKFVPHRRQVDDGLPKTCQGLQATIS